MRVRFVLPTVLTLLVLFASMAASANQAVQFKAALGALNHNQIERFKALSTPLIDNILYPYLRYAYLEHQIRSANRAEINAFLNRNSRLPISITLRRDWLLELARRRDWSAFLSEYSGRRDTRVVCARVQALAATGQMRSALSLARDMWLSGNSQPESCDPIFKLLSSHHLMKPAMIRERVLLALTAHHEGLARYLSRKLPAADQSITFHWLEVYNRPVTLLDQPRISLGSGKERNPIILAAFDRLAARNPIRARQIWVQVATATPDLAPDLRDRIMRDIALHAAWNGLPQAQAWLAALPDGENNDMVRIWRVRTALRNGDWPETLHAIRQMPLYQRDKPGWRYWEARALAALGHPLEAEHIARPLSKQFDYYGFLAADFLHRPYARGKSLPRLSDNMTHRAAREYLVRVALALEAADQFTDAEAAWRAAMRALNGPERLAAAELAYQHGWAYGAYEAAASAGVHNASPLMFPLDHMPHVRAAALHEGLKPGLLLAVMRQESAFQSSVCSDKGACGLLQLLPDTACWIGRHTGLGNMACSLEALSSPAINIRAGASYLAYLFRQFDNDVVLALAAYNAGPATVNHWLSTQVSAKPGSARWLATLPYGETRNYIEAVLFNRVVYTQRLEAKETTRSPKPVTSTKMERLSDALEPANLTLDTASLAIR